MKKIEFSDFPKDKNHILTLIKNKKEIYFFGAGVISEKTFASFSLRKFNGIFDNSENLHNTFERNLKILDPKLIRNLNYKDIFIIITTTSFNDVMIQLEKYGLKKNENFCVSHILKDQFAIEGMQSLKQELLFSSGSPKVKNDSFGGGIYKLTINEDKWTTKKLYNGNCFGIIRNFLDNSILFIDTDVGILKYDKNFKLLKKVKIKKGIRAHGISFCSDTQKYAVACSFKDKVLILDKNLKLVNEFNISEKIKKSKVAQHHCNDCEISQNSVYVSMFSVTGNWKKEVFDGGITEFDATSGKRVGHIKNDLWMPHNVRIINGTMHILDSLRGNLLFDNLSIQGNFPAFSRGLDFKDGLYFIGQSRNRNFSKTIGVSKNISVDTGIVVFDPTTKISRFLNVSNKISEIHSILAL
tara:strand:+ start:3425 stop:4660 length:1236 start_codon:yes stop_codon:yes gene_type:complete